MSSIMTTELYRRVLAELDTIRIIDCHEHLQRDAELPKGDAVTIGRFFAHYANCDLITAGMPPDDLLKLQDAANGLSPKQRWKLMAPWYRKAWNTGYCEALRIALRDLYNVEDFAENTVDALTDAMRKALTPGFTRRVFDKAGIDVAMNNPLFGPKLGYNPDFDPACFIVDLCADVFTYGPNLKLAQENGVEVYALDDFLRLIDSFFEKYGAAFGACKIGRAYDRSLAFEDVPKSAVERTFTRLLASEKTGEAETKALEDFLLHVLCRKCADYGVRMKFHAGLQEGTGYQVIANSRAALLANLFKKYPNTGFDIYHISYPYQEELVTLAKNYPNVTVDFCWMWIINPAAGRRALSDMLDAVPASKIHGFGGDYIFAEGAVGHAKMARREIARVLAEKVEEGRFSEDYAATVGRMLLRDNAIENFGLVKRRAAFRKIAGKQ